MFSMVSSKRFVIFLILIFVALTLATVIGLGIPVTIFLNRQVDEQMRTLLDQANQTTLALYENKNNQLNNLASLIVERPTLNRLILENVDPQALVNYLDDFLLNSGVDAIAVCKQNTPIALAGARKLPELCAPNQLNKFISINDQVWLLATAKLTAGGFSELYAVVGQQAESVFKEFTQQTGLDYVLFDNEALIVGTIEDVDTSPFQNLSPQDAHYQKLALDTGNPRMDTHLAGVIPLAEDDSQRLIGLLDIRPFRVVNRNLRNIILGTLVFVSLVGVAVAVLISQRISQPLNQLANAAVALREGDLKTPLSARSKVWEIDQLTNALEDARVSLKYSLDQLMLEKVWIENLLNSVVEGLLTIDEHRRITFASQAIEHILDIPHASILGKSLDDIFITPEGEDLFSHQLPGGNQPRKIPIGIGSNEKLLSVSAGMFLPPDAGNATRALVIRDVTDEERIHRLMGEFLANITHEFRTPLTALSASVELLLDQLPGLSTPEIVLLLQSLNIGIIDLQSLIDNLIEAASIEAGRFKVNPQSIGLDIIISDAIQTVMPIVKKQGLQLDYPNPKPDITVYADRRRTCQALVNLLSNAIKHSPEAGAITVNSAIIGDHLQVEVRDQGTGVPPNQHDQLFNRFISPESEGEYGQLGLGLGLSVVKAIVEAQNGSVGFRNDELGGAVFWFTLPIIKESAS
jgi:signal transduction histidine kinase